MGQMIKSLDSVTIIFIKYKLCQPPFQAMGHISIGEQNRKSPRPEETGGWRDRTEHKYINIRRSGGGKHY